MIVPRRAPGAVVCVFDWLASATSNSSRASDEPKPSNVTEQAVQTGSVSAKLALRGECCIDSLSERREALLRAVEDGLPIVVDVSGVTRIDTAGLQLLLAFVLDMRRQGRSVTWSSVPSVLSDGARLAGIGALLGV